MKIAEATGSTVAELWGQLEPQVQQANALEEAAQAVVAALHNHFSDSVVIARIFVTVPFDALPASNQDFVRKLADSAGATEQLKGGTPVLSLVGTHGQEEKWNDRRNSEGHVGIPLISSSFVGAIPMISRLLKELGVPLDWVDSHDTEMIVKTVGESAGLFFVEDAAEVTDQEGRKVIAAQDFVSSYNVKSVFGTGGVYPSGQMFAIVAFCRDQFSREAAQEFVALADSFKNSTSPLVGATLIFSS
ncbi:hypothetical protein MYX65_06625 [Acidobacteria bacterium AH-259-L09]|nr:hypothetical protein [Acidobacteria bacterium AH-259-L09]